MELNKINKISEIIKKNKKYSSISEDVITDEIESYFRKNPNKLDLLEKQKSEKFKKIIKEIRSNLHKSYGSFQTEDKAKRDDYLRKISSINDFRTHDLILSTSVSAKERLNDYSKLYKKIFSITGKPQSIIDLGCGLNPVSLPYMGINSCIYHAYDIDENDIAFLNRYFGLMKHYSNIKGTASVLNLKNNLLKIPKADICFLFKVFDVIEKDNHKLSESIIKSLNCKYIIVSFSTKTVSGKHMNHPYRGWIERMLERINLKYEKISLENEVFYIIIR
jgi:16S rRNA (guanine(1405)-N(7))-methyltransferase